ncbi:MAG: hypothetical protein V4487_06185 [Chlamydiota bacterium]
MTPIQKLQNHFSAENVKQFVCTWGPRTIAAAFAGYYCLGFAYQIGLMAAIDKIAIPILVHSVGYAGLGALMPHFQWYAALGVRILSATIAAFLYDLVKEICKYAIRKFSGTAPVQTVLAFAQKNGFP